MQTLLGKLQDFARKARDRVFVPNGASTAPQPDGDGAVPPSGRVPSFVRAVLARIEERRATRPRVSLREIVRTALGRFDRRRAAEPAPEAPAADTAPAAAAEPVIEKKKPVNWELRTQAELVDYIVEHHHAGLRRDLPALVDAARRVAREHASHPAVPRDLADELATLFAALDGHMLKEETVLFPLLRTNARGGQLDMPIRMMERDHEDHADGLSRIREQTANLTAPPDASQAWIDLYAALATLEADLQEHIYLENNILFARASGGGGGLE